ncbi:MAG: TetR/AcrR family transcriptional regulator [Faecousia sp.]
MAVTDQFEALRRHSRENNELTKDSIKSAMLELSKDRPFREVSVTELCRKAGVSRMAFYRNYRVTNDVFFEIASDLNREVTETIGSPFRMSTSREWYVKIFQIVASHKSTLTLMFQEHFQYQWMKAVNGFAVHDSFPPEKTYQRIMWSGGFENAVSQWLNSGMKETPEEMAEYCIRYLPHLLNGSE